MKKYHELTACVTKRAANDSPEYFEFSFDFRLQFLIRQCDLKEVTLRVFDDNLHSVGSDSIQLTPTYSYRSLNFSVGVMECTKDRPYTIFIYVNGQPRWTTEMLIGKKVGVEINSIIRPIDTESDEMFFASNACIAPWWGSLDRSYLKKETMTFLLTRIKYYTTMLDNKAWDRLPNICVCTTYDLASSLALGVFDIIASRNHEVSSLYISIDDIAMESIYGLKRLSFDIERRKVAVVDLYYRHQYNARQQSQIKTFLADIRNGKFSQTTFIFYGSIRTVDDIAKNHPIFKDIVQEIGTFLISSTYFDQSTWGFMSWLAQERLEEEANKTLPIAENKPEPESYKVDVDTENKYAKPELTDAERQLYDMVGLERMKREINDMRNMTFFNLRRYELNLEDATDNRFHMLFLGNPGTGKTTVAKLIGAMYHSMGILTSGHTVEVNRSTLIGEYIGQTEARTKEYIKKAEGGVLFIDEAYSLFSDSNSTNDFGKHVLNSLLPVLAEPNPNMIIIMAGYEDKIDYMLQSNQGLRERFPIRIHFDDYTADELLQIAHYTCAKRGFVLTTEADERLRIYIENETKKRTPSFSNARWVNNLMYQGVIKSMANRVLATTSETDLNKLYTTIEEADIITAEQEFKACKPSTQRRSPIGFM